MRRVIAVLAAFVSVAAVVPSADAAKYRFKVDLAVKQVVGWDAHWRDDAWCGEDYHRDYRGEGGGTLKGRLRGGRVTFRTRQGFLQTAGFRVPATRRAANDWTVQWVGAPDENCPPNLPPAAPPDTSQCGKTVAGSFDSQLIVVRGRLALAGGFDPKGSPDPVPCSDPTGMSVAGAPGSPKRRDVGSLIKNKRVRSIQLGVDLAAEDIPTGKLNLPAQESNILGGSGLYDASWSVKLTRIYGR